jgi:hypothetical protein
MAKANAKHTPPGWKWVLLGDYLEQKSVEVHSPRLAEQLVRDELEERRREYCYLDRDGKPHRNNLPAGFCLEAKINREESSARRPAKPIPPDPSLTWLARHARQVDDVKRAIMGLPQPPGPSASDGPGA